MRLVDYSSDEDSEEDLQRKAPIAASQLPALPSDFHDLYSVKPWVGNDPSLHEGRIRNQPHVAGQWATHAYLEFRPSSALHELLHDIVTKAIRERPQIKSLLFTEVGNIAPLHVSLTRPLILWTNEKETFLDAFTNAVEKSHLQPFDLSVADVECFINHESTRKFLVLRLKMSEQLTRLAEAIDQVVVAFGRPRLYDNPVYHISIAWSGMTCEMDSSFCKALEQEFGKIVGMTIPVWQVKLKIGNEISTVCLRVD